MAWSASCIVSILKHTSSACSMERTMTEALEMSLPWSFYLAEKSRLKFVLANRILSRESKSFVCCSHMNCCLQKHTTHQFPYFIYSYYFHIKTSSRIIKIHQVHQKIHTKQFLLFCLTCFVFCNAERVFVSRVA